MKKQMTRNILKGLKIAFFAGSTLPFLAGVGLAASAAPATPAPAAKQAAPAKPAVKAKPAPAATPAPAAAATTAAPAPITPPASAVTPAPTPPPAPAPTAAPATTPPLAPLVLPPATATGTGTGTGTGVLPLPIGAKDDVPIPVAPPPTVLGKPPAPVPALPLVELPTNAGLGRGGGWSVDRFILKRLTDQLNTTRAELRELQVQHNTIREQRDLIEKQYNLLLADLKAKTGSRASGKLYNSGAQLAARGSALSLDDIINSASNGGAIKGDTNDRLKAIVEDLKKKYPLKDYHKYSNEKTNKKYTKEDREFERGFKRVSSSGIAAVALAKRSYQVANESMRRSNSYLNDITNTADIKESIDLNSRILVELLQMNNENLRLQAAFTTVSGSFSIQGGAARMKQREALDF